MSQHDFSIANQTASNARADINNALQALASNNSGNSAPSTTYANMWWYENDTNLLKIRNESDNGWISVAYLDGSNWEILDNTQVVNTSGTQIGVLGDQTTGTWTTGTGIIESLVSPAKVAASATEVVGDYALGVDQTWQDVGSSRAIGTIYQNTTGRPIIVSILGSPSSGGFTFFDVSTNNFSSYVSISGARDHDGYSEMGGVIPSSHYYRLRISSGGMVFSKWAELR
jgi:hypothetical protein